MARRLPGAALAVLLFCGCGADMRTQVRTRAARDLSCGQEKTRILDAEAGVYRISGCGLEASYRCTEDMGLNTRCERLYLSKVTGSEPAAKPQPGTDLAKSQ